MNSGTRARISSGFVAIGLLLVSLRGAPAEDAAPLEAARIAKLIQALDARDYQVRNDASRRLADAGAVVIDPLVAASKTGSLELRMRAVDLLGRIYSRGEEASFEPAELALEQVSREDRGSLREHARAVLETNYDVRQRLAVAAISELGGSVMYEPQSNPPEPGEMPADAEPGPRRVLAVVINQDWTGGDAGLRHIRRLTRLSILYRVKKAPVSDEAIDELHAEMPQLAIQSRGPAYLGVTNFFHPRGCGVGRVQPGSAAAKAGIEVQDVITQFDGQRVTDFDQLVDLIAEKLPGQTVPISVERMGQTLELKAELAPWPKEQLPGVVPDRRPVIKPVK